MIVILSYPTDPHLSFVTRHIGENGYIVIDPTTLVEGTTLHMVVCGGLVKTYYDGRLLDDITGVWIRRPTNAREIDLPVEERFIPYVRSALNKTYNQLYDLFPDATWVSDRYALRRANNKVLQLKTAVDVGLNVPPTILSSDSKRIREFVEDSGDVIMKPVATTYPARQDGASRLFFTTKVDKERELDLSGINLAPTFFQQHITPNKEIRATVVGDKIFAATVETVDQKAHHETRDWRYGYLEGEVRHQEYSLPEATAKRCIALVKKLGLNFGACDLIEDENGKIWFLEVNPNGQWAFIEQATGQPIGEEIARLLGAR